MEVKSPLVSPSGRIKLIVPTTEWDADAAALRTHPETRKYIRWLPGSESFGPEEAKKRREERAQDETVLDYIIILIDEEGKEIFAGAIGLLGIAQNPIMNQCDSGIAVSPNLFQQGVATEAFYTLLEHAFTDKNFHKVLFETSEENVPMQRWLDKASAKIEGRSRSCWKDGPGKWISAVRYSILEDEWKDEVKGKLEAQMKARK